MPRGGSRSGKAGSSYTNRSDLNTKPRLPVTTVPGQPYGAAGAQAAAQKAVPMGTPALPQMPDLTDHPGPLPGELPPLTSPTQRPNEPVTHGLPTGPGGGTEVLPVNALGTPAAYANAHDLLTSLAQTSNSPTLNSLLGYLNGGL